MSTNDTAYGVIVPVKPVSVAKSRLAGLGDRVRRDLAAAFAADTVTAATRADLVATVLVVTDDHRLARRLSGLGAEVLPDGTSDDLNGTLEQAAAEVVRRSPGLRLAALCADLPALRHDELDRALARAPEDRMGFVADVEGLGTTLVTAPSLDSFRPGFGTASREAHLEAGAGEIDADGLPGLRRDVDTPEDLVAALGLGIGPSTSRLTADLL